MTALVFAAGWLVGAASLAFGLGALLGWIDRNDPPAPVVEDVPLYVPQEWLA